MKSISEKLKNCNLKVTPQRMAIYSMLCNTTAHPSAESIYRFLQDEYPSMSLATVYKTLDTLKKSNLIQELNVGEDSFRYDARNELHAHMICDKCKRVIDVPTLLSLESVKKDIESDLNFNITGEQIYFYGTCKECKKD